MTHQTQEFYRFASRFTFDAWVELWWAARGVDADQADKHAARLAAPDDMFGKSATYTAEYYAKRAQATP